MQYQTIQKKSQKNRGRLSCGFFILNTFTLSRNFLLQKEPVVGIYTFKPWWIWSIYLQPLDIEIMLSDPDCTYKKCLVYQIQIHGQISSLKMGIMLYDVQTDSVKNFGPSWLQSKLGCGQWNVLVVLQEEESLKKMLGISGLWLSVTVLLFMNLWSNFWVLVLVEGIKILMWEWKGATVTMIKVKRFSAVSKLEINLI